MKIQILPQKKDGGRLGMKQEEKMNKIIDPKNPHTVGKSLLNLGNHVLIAGFIAIISWVIWMSYV